MKTIPFINPGTGEKFGEVAMATPTSPHAWFFQDLQVIQQQAYESL